MPDIQSLQREVSTEPGEFIRILRMAFPGRVEQAGDFFRIDNGSTTMEISLAVGQVRRIANLCLPTLHVGIRFTAGTADEQQKMLAHMDRAMHRGGG